MKHLSHILCFLCLVLASCSSDSENKLNVDISSIELNLETERWDQELKRIDSSKYEQFVNEKYESNPKLWDYYVSSFLNIGDAKDPMFPNNFAFFLKQQHIQMQMAILDSSDSDIDKATNEITKAFKHLKYYYPDAVIPKIIYVNGFFNRAVWATEDAVFIGLDYYLGRDHKLIRSLPPQSYPAFIKYKMDPEFLVADVMYTWFQTHYMEEVKTDQFGMPQFHEMLDAMMYYGKLMYALDAMLPDIAPHLRMRYSKEKMTWATVNEVRIWTTMVDRKLIHSKDKKVMDDYIKEGPFTSSLKGNESPDRIGVFLGWQIVKDYMNANEKLTLPDLLKINESQTILNAYNPEEE